MSKQLYLKYKIKYLNLKNQLGGECNPLPPKDYENAIGLSNLSDVPGRERITINGKCYNIYEIYEWAINRRHALDPIRIEISEIDKRRIELAYNSLPYTTEELYDIDRIKSGTLRYRNASLKVKSDKDLALYMISEDRRTIIDVSKVLKKTVKHTELSDARIVFTEDYEFMLEVNTSNGPTLQEVTNDQLHIVDDDDFMLEVVRTNVESLEYASREIKDDPYFILKAIVIDVKSLSYASSNIRSDFDFMTNACKINVESLSYAHDRLKSDLNFMTNACNIDVNALNYASIHLKGTSRFILEVIKINTEALKYASDRLKNDRAFILQCVKINGLVLEHVLEKFKDDKEIVQVALKQNVGAIQFVSSNLKEDPFILEKAINNLYIHIKTYQTIKSNDYIIKTSI
jgi:hypothetical protein